MYEDANAAWANPAVRGDQPINLLRARWLSELSHRIVFAASAAPAVSHVVNLGLHLTNGVLVAGIASAWLSPLGALAAAAIFLLAPIQTEAVAYVASRSELLATLFALLAFTLSSRVRTWYGWTLVGFAVGLAVCAKESAAVIVPIIGLAAYVRGYRLRLAGLLLFVPVAAITASVIWFDYHSTADVGPLAYAATQATALWRYLGLVGWPYGLSIDHDFEIVAWPVRWLALVGLVTGGAILLLLLATVGDEHGQPQRRLHAELGIPLAVVFGGLWVLVALAPRFVIRIPEFLNQHQFYLPMVGLALVIGRVFGGEVATGCHQPNEHAFSDAIPCGNSRLDK